MAMIESKDRATSDPKARKAVLDEVKKEGVEYVLFWFTDIEGHLKSFAITPSEIEGALNDGMGFDGSSITGFNAIEESDMVAIPDPGTWRLMPTRAGEAKVGRMICDVVKPDGQPYEGDPRYVMRRALERMEAMGFDTFNIGPELEYFLFKDKERHRDARRGRLLRDDGARRRDRAAQRDDPRARVDGDRHRVPPPRGRAVTARDRHALLVGARHGRPDDHVPADRQGGRGEARGLRDVHAEAALRRERVGHAHAHVALQGRAGTSSSTGATSTTSPSTGKQFIAGLLRHARELSGVFAQWVNSYKRLVPGFEAPVYVAWSQRNRSALIRIPLYKPGSEQATRAEIRCPDPACNPYLTFAALLHAGLEGIEQGYELEAPMETNLYHLTAEERRDQGIVSLPETLGEAIDEFAASELMRRAFGDHIFTAT